MAPSDEMRKIAKVSAENVSLRREMGALMAGTIRPVVGVPLHDAGWILWSRPGWQYMAVLID
jgi:hypothetical protein